MGKPLVIEESMLCGKEEFDEYLVPHYMKAIDALNQQFNQDSVKVISLVSYSASNLKESPVWYDNISTRLFGSNNRPIVTGCKFYTSHYIGSFNHDGVSIIITPRYGAKIFSYLIQYATNLFIPESITGFNLAKTNPSWLIALIWKAMLNKALINSHIPKQYIVESKNRRHYKGRLAIRQHLQYNMVDQSRFYCTYHKLSLDNTINRTVRYTFRLLRKQNLSSLLYEFNQYDEKLKSFGVSNSPVSVEEINAIKFNKITSAYKEIIDVSKLIIENHDGQLTVESSKKSGLSYFIDIAELWEVYLLKLIQKRLVGYKVYSPNTGPGEFLLNENARSIRPDIIIEKESRVLIIIDAKYKNYTQIGKNAGQSKAVSREDLYQMCTYLYHYGHQDDKIIGLFVSPTSKQGNDILKFSGNENHKLGILNLPIGDMPENTTIQEIRKEEDNFISSMKKLLEGL